MPFNLSQSADMARSWPWATGWVKPEYGQSGIDVCIAHGEHITTTYPLLR
jgi:hypothetical protein